MIHEKGVMMKKYIFVMLLLVGSTSCAHHARVTVIGEGEFNSVYTHRDRVIAREQAWRRAQRHCRDRAVLVRENLRPNGRVYSSEVVFRCN